LQTINHQIKLESPRIASCECPKILIVDDDEFNLYALTIFLEEMGHTDIVTANNGKDVISLV
jgi:CheY-like chemotaxis protein